MLSVEGMVVPILYYLDHRWKRERRIVLWTGCVAWRGLVV